MKIGIIQQHNTADITNNRQRLLSKIDNIAQQGAKLIVLQELHDTLYFCQEENVGNFDQAVEIPSQATKVYSEAAARNHVVLVTSVFEKRSTGLYHNTAIVYDADGSVAGTYRKMHIPDDPGYYEKFYFTPGDLGFNPIKTSVGTLGVLVCWDQWYPEAARLMALAGAQLLIYPTAIGYDSHDTAEEQERQRQAWTLVQRGHAVANGLPVVSVNRVGDEPDHTGNGSGIDFWGSSFVAGPQGEMLYQAPKNAEAEQIVEVDLQRSEQVRRWWPFLRDRRIDAYGDLTKRFRD